MEFNENEFVIRPSACPYCEAINDCASGTVETEGKPPEPGDISICFRCANILKYDQRMQLEKVGLEDFGELHPELQYELITASTRIKEFWKKQKQTNN